MREGMPMLLRRTVASTRFDLDAMHAWLGARSGHLRSLGTAGCVSGAPGGYARAGAEGATGFVTVTRRGKKWAVPVYDARTPARCRWLGTFETEREALGAERATRLG